MFKVRYLVVVVLFALLSVSTASAQTASVAAGDDESISGLPLDPSSNLVQDPGPEGCGEIDPSKPCYTSGGTEEVCVTVTNYTTCKSKCDCEFRKNKKKCNGGLICVDVATSEKNACYGNCIIDWAS